MIYLEQWGNIFVSSKYTYSISYYKIYVWRYLKFFNSLLIRFRLRQILRVKQYEVKVLSSLSKFVEDFVWCFVFFEKSLLTAKCILSTGTTPKFRISIVHSIRNFTSWCAVSIRLLLVAGSTECSSVCSLTTTELLNPIGNLTNSSHFYYL